MKQKYKYKFSVIIPVYKVEEYLAETIESVIHQTLNFEKYIQIILVNDGSPDNSEDICLKYVEKYPDNIIYVKQKNAGVSAARNNGLNYCEGEYINFLDSDDKWELDVFEKANKMFRKHPEIDMIGVRQQFFEALNTYPSLDFKFNRDKIIDIFNDYDHIQLSVTSGFIRADAIEDIRFDTKVKYSEDAKFIFEILFKKEKLGIISSSVHLYRKRFAETSAIQTKGKDNDWYLVTPERCYKYVYDLSIKKYGYIIPYVQYYIMYDYQYRMKESIPDNINQEVISKYMKITTELLKEIDDEVILKQRNIFSEYKFEVFKIKYGEKVIEKLKYINHKIYLNGMYLCDLESEHILTLGTMEITKNNIEISGVVNLLLPKELYKINLVINGTEKIPLEINDSNLYPRRVFNELFLTNKTFKIKFSKKNVKRFYFELVYNKHYVTKLNFKVCKCFKISKNSAGYLKGGQIYFYKKRGINVVPNNKENRVKYIKSYYLKRKFNDIKNIKIALTYNLFRIAKKINKNKIWIFSDRPYAAGDNGLAMFKYVNKIKPENVKTYFVLNKNSKDYKCVKKIGNVLKFNSLKYKILFLISDKIISSHFDEWVTNPFGKDLDIYRSLFKFDYIFLQHGVTKDDLSPWLNAYQKDINLFISSSQQEYKSLLEDKYGYGNDIIKLTGMPRYDYLKNDAKKLIAIMPTWRLTVAGRPNDEKGERLYNPSFKHSKYFKFYNDLINDSELIESMKKRGYKGIFVVHPSHLSNAKDFIGNDIIEVVSGVADYSDIFSQASLLISDYSSVPFDFAYLNKPVLYTQFDKDDFFSSHTYKEGYFSYEKDGLGPVVYNYEDTKKKMIEYINNNCKIEEKYKKRIDKFYKYNDKNNCERVYKEIINMKK